MTIPQELDEFLHGELIVLCKTEEQLEQLEGLVDDCTPLVIDTDCFNELSRGQAKTFYFYFDYEEDEDMVYYWNTIEGLVDSIGEKAKDIGVMDASVFFGIVTRFVDKSLFPLRSLVKTPRGDVGTVYSYDLTDTEYAFCYCEDLHGDYLGHYRFEELKAFS